MAKPTFKIFGFLVFLLPIAAFGFQNMPKVNQDRLEKRIMDLAEFGKDSLGQGNRVAFSQGDIAARNFVLEEMKNLGLETRIDAAGNIIGRREGTRAGLKPIAFGSHIDMVPHGGNYDGCVGAMAALEVMAALNENNIRTEHPLEAIIFPNEEGGVMGSRAIVGHLGKDALSVVNSTGFSMKEGISRLGGNPEELEKAVRSKGDIAAFLELHIEQGGILDQEGIDIGVVEGIVGINWWDVTFEGFANHAGTTPMSMRQDALLAAAKFIVAVNEIANSYEGRQVGTVGRIRAEPGAPNVIPGRVVLSLEIRDLSSEKIDSLFADMEAKAEEIASNAGVKISFAPIDATGKSALTEPEIRNIISETASKLGLSQMQMQSGAGHDAQDMALIAPVGMIFVPSKDGISHSPEEYTSPEAMANGANVLLGAILELDKKF